jgi:hypothetical protein
VIGAGNRAPADKTGVTYPGGPTAAGEPSSPALRIRSPDPHRSSHDSNLEFTGGQPVVYVEVLGGQKVPHWTVIDSGLRKVQARDGLLV